MAVITVSPLGGNWNATTTWVGGVVPIASDTVNFTATSGNLTVNVSTANLIGIDFTNYVNTITFNQPINTNGTVNLGNNGYTQAGTSGLVINGATTISGTTIWSRTFTFSGTTYTVTLSNDLNITGLTTVSISTSLSFSTGTNLFNPKGNLTISVTANAGNVNLPNDIYINTLIINCLNNPQINLNKIYVSSNLQIDNTNTAVGTTEIVLTGDGTWNNTSNGQLKINLTINSVGTIKLGTNIYYNSAKLTYISGKVITKNSTLNIQSTTTLINCHKINFNNVIISSGQSVTMNEFFNGSPGFITNVRSSSSTTNYTITFQDGFEKITKFTKISGCTLTKPMQLLSLNNITTKSTNRGVRYINQSPNGIAKDNPSTSTQVTYNSNTSMLISDPGMK
jgi:hypothetical protein